MLLYIIVPYLVIRYFLSKDYGTKEPIGKLWLAFLFGFIASIVVNLLINELSVTLSGATLVQHIEGQIYSNPFRAILGIFVAAVAEEVFKFLPLALYIRKKGYFNESTDGVIYFAISGFTFGFLENVLYAFLLGPQVAIVRATINPIFHGASTGMVGYYFSKNEFRGKHFSKTLIVLFIFSLIHALYNMGSFFVSDVSILLSLMLSVVVPVGLFVLFKKARKKDKELGISSSEPNKYCTKCGKKNKNGTLFCENCGKDFRI